jgi:hypothetical protein
MQKNRIVMLLGAGAATPWKGMLTKDLTNYIIQNFKTKTQSGLNFLKFLQQYYVDSFNKNKKINIQTEDVHFEILISIVEYLTEYYENINQTPIISLRPEWIEFFEINDNFRNELPKIIRLSIGYYNTAYEFSFENNPHLKLTTQEGFEYSRFFNRIHDEITDIIKMHIYEYSKNEQASAQMKLFLNMLSKRNILRIYSTNYDNIINDLKLDLPIFNGFENVIQEEEIEQFLNMKTQEKGLEFNLIKTLLNFEINCFYSLHGNVNYTAVSFHGKTKSISPLVYIPNRDPFFYYHHDDASEVTVGKYNIRNYNLISGQRKIINTYIEPYKSFLNVFQKECLLTDAILCIGTSFLDYHIQSQIYNAISIYSKDSNKKLKIIIITKLDITDCSELGATKNILEVLLKNVQYHQNIFPRFYNCKKINWFESNNEGAEPPYVCEVKFKIYTNGFDEFLKDDSNWKEIIN